MPLADLFWYDEYDTAHPLRSFLPTAARVLFQPRRFFARVDPEGSFLTPLVFASFYSGVYATLSTISAALMEVTVHGASLALPNLIGATLANILASILAVWLLTPPLAAVCHLLVRLVVGRSNRGFRATFRVMAYAGATDLIGWVPIVGLPLAGVWALVLTTIGFRELHATTLRRAAAAMLLPAALSVVGAAGLLLAGPPFDLARR